ncbi:MAG: dTMP kinase [Pseudomonadota bacterium]|nr:dTMP kinase [Pseudomonadota bacterium]
MKPGSFITFEGIEGAGKSCNISHAGMLLENSAKQVMLTREPGGTPLGESLRELLLGHKHDDISSTAELLLMFAARAQHLQSKILPALERGEWVICDRFTDATYAYQGGGRNLDTAAIAALESLVQGERRPDLTILLDLPVSMGLERAGKRSAPDRFEREKHDFFERVRSAYLQIAERDPQRVKVVDASVPLQQVQQQIERVLSAFLESA